MSFDKPEQAPQEGLSPEAIAWREECVINFLQKYTARIRKDETDPERTRGGSSLQEATRATMIVLREVRAQDNETSEFASAHAYVQIGEPEAYSLNYRYSNINPWSKDEKIQRNPLMTIRIGANESFSEPRVIAPTLSYMVELLDGDAARVTAMNHMKGGMRIIDSQEADQLAMLLQEVFAEE
jgi:hypothetical protein